MVVQSVFVFLLYTPKSNEIFIDLCLFCPQSIIAVHPQVLWYLADRPAKVTTVPVVDLFKSRRPPKKMPDQKWQTKPHCLFLWMLHVWLSDEKTRKLPCKHNWDYSLGLWDSQSLCSVNQKQLESASWFKKQMKKRVFIVTVSHPGLVDCIHALCSFTLLLLSHLQTALTDVLLVLNSSPRISHQTPIKTP